MENIFLHTKISASRQSWHPLYEQTHYCQTATLWFNIDISRKKSLVFYFLPSVLFILNILNKIPANLQNGNLQTYSKYLIAVVNQGLLHVILCLSIPTWAPRAVNYTRNNAQVVTGLQTSCYKSVHKLFTSCVRTACSQLLEQVWKKLLTTCNKLDGIFNIRLVTRLF
jgi:hypothetical protein